MPVVIGRSKKIDKELLRVAAAADPAAEISTSETRQDDGFGMYSRLDTPTS